MYSFEDLPTQEGRTRDAGLSSMTAYWRQKKTVSMSYMRRGTFVIPADQVQEILVIFSTDAGLFKRTKISNNPSLLSNISCSS